MHVDGSTFHVQFSFCGLEQSKTLNSTYHTTPPKQLFWKLFRIHSKQVAYFNMIKYVLIIKKKKIYLLQKAIMVIVWILAPETRTCTFLQARERQIWEFITLLRVKNMHFKTIFSFYLKQILLCLKLLEILKIYVF